MTTFRVHVQGGDKIDVQAETAKAAEAEVRVQLPKAIITKIKVVREVDEQ